MNRGKLDTDTLLKLVLILVVIWLAIEVLESAIGLLFGPFTSLFGVLIVIILVLWFLDYI